MATVFTVEKFSFGFTGSGINRYKIVDQKGNTLSPVAFFKDFEFVSRSDAEDFAQKLTAAKFRSTETARNFLGKNAFVNVPSTITRIGWTVPSKVAMEKLNKRIAKNLQVKTIK